jgi:hypothetical protein
MRAVAPYLEAARSAGFVEVDAWVVAPARHFTSLTRGTLVEPYPVCRVSRRLDGPVGDGGVWQAWVETPPAEPSSN